MAGEPIVNYLAHLEEDVQQILRIRNLTDISIILYHRNLRTLTDLWALSLADQMEVVGHVNLLYVICISFMNVFYVVVPFVGVPVVSELPLFGLY